MKRRELEHVIRAVAGIADDPEIIVIGSQAVLGSIPDAPSTLVVSVEADVIPKNRPERAELIEGAIGEGSLFHDTFGYYANGVGYDTAVLPKGWEKRLVPVRSADTGDNIRKVKITPLPTTWTAASGEPTARRKSSSSAFRA